MTDREILQIFADATDPFLFTGEVADQLGFSNHGASKRLRQLVEDGLLNVKRSGRIPAWWLSEEGAKTAADINRE